MGRNIEEAVESTVFECNGNEPIPSTCADTYNCVPKSAFPFFPDIEDGDDEDKDGDDDCLREAGWILV
jgi:hypothetical protein